MTEAWKITHIPEYPIKWELKSTQEDERQTRATESKKIPESARSTLSQSTFNNDAKKIWNLAPKNIKECSSLISAKSAIKKYVAGLPL